MKLKEQLENKIGTQDANGILATVKDIPIGDIKIRTNVRDNYDPEKIDELAISIKKYGLLQPITVFKDEGQYYVKTGHRRFLAYSKLHEESPAQFSIIRCIVTDAEDIRIIQLIENVQRENLSQGELVAALTEMRNEGMTLQQIADALGKKETFIKKLFVGINKINDDAELKDIIKNSENVNIEDVVETNGLTPEDQKNILREKAATGMTRATLRAKTAEKKNNTTTEKVSLAKPFPWKIYTLEDDDKSFAINIKLQDWTAFQNFKNELTDFLNKNNWRQK